MGKHRADKHRTTLLIATSCQRLLQQAPDTRRDLHGLSTLGVHSTADVSISHIAAPAAASNAAASTMPAKPTPRYCAVMSH